MRPRRYAGLVVGLTVLLLVAVVCGAALTAGLLPSGSLSRVGGPSGGPSTEAPTNPAVPADPDPGRMSERLYAVALPRGTASCRVAVRSPQRPLPDPDYAPYVRSLVNCLVELYAGPLARQGVALEAPHVQGFQRSLHTPCGRTYDAVTTATYCKITGTIHLAVRADDDGLGRLGLARLGYVAMVAHEFAHHLQHVTGIRPALGAEVDQQVLDARARRFELQATCIAGASVAALAEALKLTERDRDELWADREFSGDEDPPEGRTPNHGTSRAQQDWLSRGLDSTDLAACNTWAVPESSVT